MKNVNRMQTAPVPYPRSKRNHPIGKFTSGKAGVCLPIAAIPLFRGDGIVGRKSSNGKWTSSRINFEIEMAETKDRIANKVRARITAYCVPLLALERFGGSRDEFDKSYAKEAGLAGQVIPFIETHAMPAYGASPFYDLLGLHGDPGDPMNTMYLEARNAIWNFRATNRSQKITQRSRLDQSHPPAFWPAGRFEHLVADFDSATMDGHVPLDVISPRIPLRGMLIGTRGATAAHAGIDTNGAGKGVTGWAVEGAGAAVGAGEAHLIVAAKLGSDNSTWLPEVFAEMQANNLAFNLANVEMVKQVQSFAKVRKMYEGHNDDYIIDTFLMNGIRLPDQAMKQPFLIADQTVTFSQSSRNATNSGHLDEKAVSGFAQGSITLRVPSLDVGGIVIVQVEILPDQLWERQRDPFLHCTDQEEWPQAMRDFADPEKVQIVTNGEVDADHDDPNGLFAFAPLNWKWNAFGPGIGGKFKKPQAGGGTNVLRQRFWAHEEQNPEFSENFFLCKGLTTSIFLDETQDQFEMSVQGNVVLDGLTQFGRDLIEATDNYEKVMENMDQTRVKDEA